MTSNKSRKKGGAGHRGRNAHANRNAAPEVVEIFGIHAVEAALLNPARRIANIWISDHAADRLGDGIAHMSASLEGGIRHVSPKDLDQRLGRNTVHQGVLIETAPLPAPALEDIPRNAPAVILDQVTDPHNVGAVLRSAAVFGASSVIVTKRHSPLPSGVLAKSASGALEHVSLVPVTNLSRALETLAELGFQRIGLDGGAGQALETVDLTGPQALVFGAEGRGLRRLTAEHCDLLCRITTAGPLASLNVSNAVAVTLHAASQARLADAK